MTAATNQSNRARGAYGERRAAEWYERHGYEVLARNWRHGRSGEIDLVVRSGRTIVVCEVKARKSDAFGAPAEAVTAAKQRRLYLLGCAFLASHSLHGVDLRFDVAAVTGTDLEMYVDAF